MVPYTTYRFNNIDPRAISLTGWAMTSFGDMEQATIKWYATTCFCFGRVIFELILEKV